MRFFVLGDQGQKYGPADILTLNQWIIEGRIVPHTMLMEEVSGGQIAAASVAGLEFPVVPHGTMGMPPGRAVMPGYQPIQLTSFSGPAPGVSDFRLALAMGVISLVVTFPIHFLGIFVALAGVRAAVRAKNFNHPLWTPALILNIIALIVAISVYVIR